MPLIDATDLIKNAAPIPYRDDLVIVVRTAHGNVTVKCDSGVGSGDAAAVFHALAVGLHAGQTAPALLHELHEREETPPPPAPRSLPIDPEDITEDLVRWQDGYTAYKTLGGSWWWVKWRPDTGECWSRSGPNPAAVSERKGPFDNFDETLTSVAAARASSKLGTARYGR